MSVFCTTPHNRSSCMPSCCFCWSKWYRLNIYPMWLGLGKGGGCRRCFVGLHHSTPCCLRVANQTGLYSPLRTPAAPLVSHCAHGSAWDPSHLTGITLHLYCSYQRWMEELQPTQLQKVLHLISRTMRVPLSQQCPFLAGTLGAL